MEQAAYILFALGNSDTEYLTDNFDGVEQAEQYFKEWAESEGEYMPRDFLTHFYYIYYTEIDGHFEPISVHHLGDFTG